MKLSQRHRGPRKQSNVRSLALQNVRSARRHWVLSVRQLVILKTLTEEFQLSVVRGDLKLLDNKWYVTHSGLLRLARRNHCAAIHVLPVREFCDAAASRWIFRATIYKTSTSKGFVGYGDADPSNVSPLVRGAEMRIAETRAVNRALRKAYGIGLCSVEELGYLSSRAEPTGGTPTVHTPPKGNGSHNQSPRLRDRLCLLIREHRLDSALVKRYAADFCGTQELRDASRRLVESFIQHVAEWAAKDHAGLICKLNGYAQPQEVQQ